MPCSTLERIVAAWTRVDKQRQRNQTRDDESCHLTQSSFSSLPERAASFTRRANRRSRSSRSFSRESFQLGSPSNSTSSWSTNCLLLLLLPIFRILIFSEERPIRPKILLSLENLSRASNFLVKLNLLSLTKKTTFCHLIIKLIKVNTLTHRLTRQNGNSVDRLINLLHVMKPFNS